MISTDKVSGIYKITSPNGKIYIGQSIHIYRRWKHYQSYRCKEQPKLFFCLKKYRVENFSFEILEQCDRDKLNEKEVFWVNHFQSCKTKHGLNIMKAGTSKTKISDETIAKWKRIKLTPERIEAMKAGRAKVGAWNKGINNCYSKEVVESIKEKLRQRPGTMLGKKQSESTKEKIRISSSRLWTESAKEKNRITRTQNNTLKFSEEHKNKLSIAHKGKSKSKAHIKSLQDAWDKRRGIKVMSEEERIRRSTATAIWWAKRKTQITNE